MVLTTTTENMVNAMVSTTGQIIDGAWPIFYWGLGLATALLVVGLMIKVFRNIV